MDNLVYKLISLIVTVISPELKKGLTDLVVKLDADAKKTSNPWDDMFVGVLKMLLGIE